MPEELVNEIDAVAGKRKRSEFIEEAVRERLLWVKQGMALDNLIASGGLNLDEYPYWATPEKVTEWVRGQRQLDNDWLKELLKRQDELADAG